MREKGLISQEEYDGAIHDLVESTGQQAGDQGTMVVGRFATTLYGFIEADSMYDTTRSFNDLAGFAAVARANTQAGQNGRFTFAVRNTRLGLRMTAPEYYHMRASAQLESDFLGNQPGTPDQLFTTPGTAGTYSGTSSNAPVSEGSYFTSPTFRIRHAFLKLETPVVDILFGQYWQLLGWQSVYQPNTVEIQGVPGELYARTPQLRISKTITSTWVTFEAAIAAMRSVERDSATPDGQAGLRFALNKWTAVQTVGATGTQISPLSIAVTGLARHVAVDNYSLTPTYTNSLGMGAIAIDGFVPVIPGRKDNNGMSLSFTGEFVKGTGFADMYTGFSGGTTFPGFAAPTTVGSMGAAPGAGTAAKIPFPADIDNGIVTYDSNGVLHSIDWQTYMLGAQFYLPGRRVWVSGNYSHATSDNNWKYGTPTATIDSYDWFDVNLFFQPTPAVRFGVEYANFNTMYSDGQHAINHRGQLSGWFVF
jgi:hypothetical protein